MSVRKIRINLNSPVTAKWKVNFDINHISGLKNERVIHAATTKRNKFSD